MDLVHRVCQRYLISNSESYKLKTNLLETSKTYIDGEHPLLVLHVLRRDGLKIHRLFLFVGEIEMKTLELYFHICHLTGYLPAWPACTYFVFGIVTLDFH